MTTLSRLGESGILFFPVTPFSATGEVDLDALGEHIESRMAWEPDAVFVACGTGEFGSLAPAEYAEVVARAVSVVAGRVPVISGAGHSVALARDYIGAAHAAGADGILLFPPAGAASQAGLVAHYSQIATSSPLPIVLYQRDGVRFALDTIKSLSAIDAIVGFKDGSGDLERLGRIVLAAPARWSFFNGMPTAELSARAYSAIGVRPYSSAVFAFLPEVATAFRQALVDADDARMDLLLREFYGPLGELRDRAPGYAVSLVKAGVGLRGIDAGGVRAPLTDPDPGDRAELAALIERGLTVTS